MDLQGKCVLLGVTGGIAAYKMANVASALKKLGADVEVIIRERQATRLLWQGSRSKAPERFCRKGKI